jgi:hypothetical protein
LFCGSGGCDITYQRGWKGNGMKKKGVEKNRVREVIKADGNWYSGDCGGKKKKIEKKHNSDCG